MKKLLEKQVVFNGTLKFLSAFAKGRHFHYITRLLTSGFAKLNLLLNKPSKPTDIQGLAETWQKLMPPDGQQYFKITEVTGDTAFTEIHLHCPLRGSGNPHACHRLMNYDRKLMEKVGGQLVVLESQSNSGQPYCKLAIRKQGVSIADLTAAHEQPDDGQ